MRNTIQFDNDLIFQSLQLTSDEARLGCKKQVRVGNRLISVYVPANSSSGDKIEIRSNDGATVCVVEITVIGGGSSNKTRLAPIHADKRFIYAAVAIALAAVVAIVLLNRPEHVPPVPDNSSSVETSEEDIGSITETDTDSEPSDSTAVVKEPETTAEPDVQYNEYGFVIGQSYEVQENLRVRAGPGKEYRILARDELLSDDYAISVNSKTTKDALIEKGKWVTCQGMQDNWMKISSGWICVNDEGEELVK